MTIEDRGLPGSLPPSPCLSPVTKTISKFTTPDYKARHKPSDDYSEWQVWPSRPLRVRRQHSRSEGNENEYKLFGSPRAKDRAASFDTTAATPAFKVEIYTPPPKAARTRRPDVDPAASRSLQTEFLAKYQAARTPSFARAPEAMPIPSARPGARPRQPSPSPQLRVGSAPPKVCMAPFNPAGGKLRSLAAFFFSQAYGLEDHHLRPHDEIIRDAQALTDCSLRAINEVLYGFSYDDVLARLRAQIPVYPPKVRNRDRNVDKNREILLAYVAGLGAMRIEPRAATAPTSPNWQRAKQVAKFTAGTALMLSPFMF